MLVPHLQELNGPVKHLVASYTNTFNRRFHKNIRHQPKGIRCDGRQVFDVGLNGKSQVLMTLGKIKPTQAPSFVAEACGY